VATHRDITHLFANRRFEASSLQFGRRHLDFLKPEETIFGEEGGAEEEWGVELT